MLIPSSLLSVLQSQDPIKTTFIKRTVKVNRTEKIRSKKNKKLNDLFN